ncbi:hypothetical protein Lal_00027948 [Lupinus albus]|nr:hypothetical protein Lal_00027948 [Lupinus albus]
MAGRGTSQNVQNELLVQMVATLQQMNENLRSLNQNPAPSPSSQNLVPPGPAEYQGLDEFCKRNPVSSTEDLLRKLPSSGFREYNGFSGP